MHLILENSVCSRPVDELAPYIKAARWIARGIEPWLDVRDILTAGVYLDAKEYTHTSVANMQVQFYLCRLPP